MLANRKNFDFLADGSVIHLNTDSVISFSFTRAHRDARIDKGEAHFDVAHDQARPFVVIAGDRRVEVVGTAFDIRRDESGVLITVDRGIVKVSAIGDANSTLRLEAGDQYVGARGVPGRVVKADLAKVLAWREGRRLIFEDAALSEVVFDLNRYFGQKVTLDPSARDLRFSGILKIDDEPSILHRLESFLPVTAVTQGSNLVLKRRPPA